MIKISPIVVEVAAAGLSIAAEFVNDQINERKLDEKIDEKVNQAIAALTQNDVES